MRISILGNSGSGKSTLARQLASSTGTATLDLDTLVWESNRIAVARDPAAVLRDLDAFCERHDAWIIEGCYASVIAASLRHGPELILLDPGEEVCLDHCRKRPWEPHKYASQDEQDAKLAFLLDWVGEYYARDGDMSAKAHHAVFDAYSGRKRHLTDA